MDRENSDNEWGQQSVSITRLRASTVKSASINISYNILKYQWTTHTRINIALWNWLQI